MDENCIDCTPEQSALVAPKGKVPSKVPTLHRLAEPETGYALYPDIPESNKGFYIIKPRETTNLLNNPTFFMGLDSWESFNATLVRTNNASFDLGFSLRVSGSGDQVTAERREYAESSISGFRPGRPYTFSMYVYLPSLWDLNDPYMGTISITDDNGTTEEEVFSPKIETVGQWVRLEVTKFIRVDALTMTVRLNLRSQDQQSNQPPFDPTGEYNLANEYLYFDMGQVEIGVEATTPFHGDYQVCGQFGNNCSGYRWLGEQHNSPSYRPLCARDSGELISLSELGFDITSHTGHGAPPITDLSHTLNNRHGEYYQKSVAGARIITLFGQVCAPSLEALECELFGLAGGLYPNLNTCHDQFLLVYRDEDCEGKTCNRGRDFALCVTYIGGLEGNRTNWFNQTLALQLKAHDPFWFEWPGNRASSIDFISVVQSSNLFAYQSDGQATGFPVTEANYTQVACLPGPNHLVLSGDFTNQPGSCDSNLAVYDCDDWCTIGGGVAGGSVHQIKSDGLGNVLVAGGFTNPCNYVMIIMADNTTGCFPGYPGGEAFSIAQTSWAMAVGSASGLHLMLEATGTWVSYITDGPINALEFDVYGNLYIAGDFSIIDGVSADKLAILTANIDGCVDESGITISSSGYDIDGSINYLALADDGILYFSGEFTQAQSTPTATCVTSGLTSVESRGLNQILQFALVGGTTYDTTITYTNILSRNHAQDIVSGGDYLTIAGSSSVGTQYNLTFSPHNTIFQSAGSVIIDGDTLYTLVIRTDTSLPVPEPCYSLNPTLRLNVEATDALLIQLAPLTLPGGIGIDNTLSSLTSSGLSVTTSYTPEAIPLNHVGSYFNGIISPMGEGLPSSQNGLVIDTTSGEVISGGYSFNGYYWYEMPWDISGEVQSLSWCADSCTLYVLTSNHGSSLLPGDTKVGYGGTAPPKNLRLVIHGPAEVEFLEQSSTNSLARFCTTIQCDEVATLDFSSGRYFSNFRPNLSPSLLSRSSTSLSLTDCDDNRISFFIRSDGPTTKATLMWQEAHFGIEALCCRLERLELEDLGCDSKRGLYMHRDPEPGDCEQEGWREGDRWLNIGSNCLSLFVFSGDCPDCEPVAYVDGEGGHFFDEEGEVICPEGDCL